MSNNFNIPCKDLKNNISSVDIFRPVKSNEIIVDNYGYEWKKETADGWIRIKDNFFIPCGPNGSFYNHKYHSVENRNLQNQHLLNLKNKK